MLHLPANERVKAEAEYARQIMKQDPTIPRDEALRIAAKWVGKDLKQMSQWNL